MLSPMSEARRPGRWRTGQQNRQRIIDAARERFMRDGYERATVRAIAADAGVDVSMVYSSSTARKDFSQHPRSPVPSTPCTSWPPFSTRGPTRSARGWCADSSSTGTKAPSSSRY